MRRLPALGEYCLSSDRWTGNMVLFLGSGSEKESSVTETPVIKKHNGLHLTLPDAHDTDCGEETNVCLSVLAACLCERGKFHFLQGGRGVTVGLARGLQSWWWSGGPAVSRIVSAAEGVTGSSASWLPHGKTAR